MPRLMYDGVRMKIHARLILVTICLIILDCCGGPDVTLYLFT